MVEKLFQKRNPVIVIISILFLWIKKLIKNQMEKARGIGLSSVAQWCVILVMLYFTLAG